ncbi:L-carnitine dehydratase/bile acid-inducible protein F [hydrothermal vent metagenome]|uniref:L-carnitine dehydratase/bile acid-inducible protein F n=1 Tax=hydrothermal vent metagenome TaxID=652676 RepID=A0A3B0TVN9_9ZZZZ
MSRPLDGVLVVTLEQAIAAPYCTRLLADQGARVIKVERPDGGDFARAYDTRARGLSSHFVWTNRSKESLALDLKEDEAVAALKAIIATADIFVQNLAPGAVERLGLDPADLRRANPRLLTCSISGYGPGGPMSKAKAYDLLIQAEAGFLSVTGTETEMAKAGISVADIAAGVTAHHLILAALLQRARTGHGDHIEVSMLEAMAEWMGFPMYYAMDGASPPRRYGADHATIFPYGSYDTADGGIIFGLQNTREWVAFTTMVLLRPDLADDQRFKGNGDRVEHRDVLEPVIAGVLASLSTEEAMARFKSAGIATAHINDMAALWDHDQLAARDRWAEFGSPAGPLRGLKPASGESWAPRFDAVPELGQHTEKILAEFAPAAKTKDGPP